MNNYKKTLLLASLAVASVSSAFATATLHNCFKDTRSYNGTGGLTPYFARCISGNETSVNDEVGVVETNLNGVGVRTTALPEVTCNNSTGACDFSAFPAKITTAFEGIQTAQYQVLCTITNPNTNVPASSWQLNFTRLSGSVKVINSATGQIISPSYPNVDRAQGLDPQQVNVALSAGTYKFQSQVYFYDVADSSSQTPLGLTTSNNGADSNRTGGFKYNCSVYVSNITYTS